MQMAPLRMAQAEWRALGLKGHSIHGTGADLVRFLGAELGFQEGDARAVGHGLRDRNAPAAEGHTSSRTPPVDTGVRRACATNATKWSGATPKA
jgi:hypothetical protein